jgi:hypothetical protein
LLGSAGLFDDPIRLKDRLVYQFRRVRWLGTDFNVPVLADSCNARFSALAPRMLACVLVTGGPAQGLVAFTFQSSGQMCATVAIGKGTETLMDGGAMESG